MDKLEQLKEQLKSLSQEEVEQLKEFLNEPKAAAETVPEEANNEETSTEDKEAPVVTEEAPTEEAPIEKPQEQIAEEAPAIENAEEQTQAPIQKDDDIPAMQKGVETDEDVAAAEPAQKVTAETGEELPIDYQQIVEAQNAKIAALQAENSSLKNKVEGAFGYSAKPAISAKVNRLYDDATDVHFRR